MVYLSTRFFTLFETGSCRFPPFHALLDVTLVLYTAQRERRFRRSAPTNGDRLQLSGTVVPAAVDGPEVSRRREAHALLAEGVAAARVPDEVHPRGAAAGLSGTALELPERSMVSG